MKNNILSLAAALFVVAAFSSIPHTSQALTQARPAQKQSSWSGSASCTVVLPNGSTKQLNAFCSGQLTYNAAKSALEADLSAQVGNAGGTMQGSITLKIGMNF